MAKQLKDILKAAHDTIKGVHKSTTEPLSVGKDPGVDLAPKAGDDNDFIAKHSVQKWDEPYGNPNYADKVPYSLEKEKHHGNTLSRAKATNEEVSDAAKKVLGDVAKKHSGKVPFTSTTYKDGKKVVTRGHNDEKGNRVVTSTTNEEVEQIDEISLKTKINAYKAAADHDADYNYGSKVHAQADRLHNRIVAKHGRAAGDHANVAAYGKAPYGDRRDNPQKSDPLTKATSSTHKMRITKSGVAHKQDQKANAAIIKSRLGKHGKSNVPEETDPGFSESKKAEDTKCNMSEAGTWCPMHEMANCSSARPIKELSTDTYHRAAKKAAKKAMWDPEGRSGKTFQKYSTMANKFRDKGMSQEKKEKAMKEAVAPGQFSEPSDSAKAKIKQIQQKDADKAAIGRAKMGIKSEEVVNEISKKVLGNYVHAATRDALTRQYALGKGDKSDTRRLMNRRKGIDKAVDKLTKEEVIDEKHLTPAEMKKREEVAQAIHRENPNMPMSKKMAIATSTAKKVAEDLAVPLLGGDRDDESAEMAKAELKAIANQAMNLVMQIPDTMIIEPWVQSKIAQAKVMVNSVHDYMVYGDHDKQKEAEGTMDTPMTFPNMSVDVNTGQNV